MYVDLSIVGKYDIDSGGSIVGISDVESGEKVITLQPGGENKM